MSQEEKLRAELIASEKNLATSERKLTERTRELDVAEHSVINSESELSDIQSEFFAVTDNLKKLAEKLALKTIQLESSNQQLAKKTKELQTCDNALSLLGQEKECFTAILRDLKNPIVGSTRILEYIAAGKASPERQPELLNQLIGLNTNLLTETEKLSVAFLKLSQTTILLDESNVDLAERTEALGEANAEIKEMKVLMQQREDFVAALTHDLKNPLIGGTRILESIAGGKITADEMPSILKQIIESNNGMLHLIWNMMEVYKNDSGCLVPSCESVDVLSLLTSCLNQFAFAIAQKGIKLKVATGSIPGLNTDKQLLRRVLMNLLDNAVKFTPDGGQISISAACTTSKLRMYVRNSGMGMSPVQLERIFDRFWQTPYGRQHGVGSGLGLFLSKQIMDSLGGQITCTSIESVGTEFTLTLELPG